MSSSYGIFTFCNSLIILLLPLAVSNLLHMVVVKIDLFKKLKLPINKKLFGKNKTWRGAIFLTLCNGMLLSILDFSFNLQLEHPFFLGFLLAASYILFELPNSFIKRRLGIPPGGQHSKHGFAFSMLDKMDSAFGVVMTFFLLGFVHIKFAILLFICCSITHFVLSKFLVFVKIKKNL